MDVGQQLRVAVRVAEHQRPDPGPLGAGCQRREGRHSLEVLAVGVAIQRIEVIPRVDGVDAEFLGLHASRICSKSACCGWIWTPMRMDTADLLLETVTASM